MKVNSIIAKLTLTCLIFLVVSPRYADGNDDLVQRATNPIGDIIQLQLQYQHGSNIGGLDGDTDTFIVQPVVPFDLPWESVPQLVTRTTIPYVSSADLPGSGSEEGLGDTVVLAVALPKLNWEGQMLGIGPALSIPTASRDELGSEKWSLGPTVVYVNKKAKGWLLGALAYAYWDIAGDDDRDDVSQYFIQPVVNRYFDGGWYVGLQDIPWNYNGETRDWFLPIGPRLGRVMKVGGQQMKVYGGAYYNPVDTTGTAEWTFKLNASLLFTK